MNPIQFFSNHPLLLLIVVMLAIVAILFFIALYMEMSEAELNKDRWLLTRGLYQAKSIECVHKEMAIENRDKLLKRSMELNGDFFRFTEGLKSSLTEEKSANNFLQKCYQSLLNNSLKKQRAYKKNLELLTA